MANSTNRQRDNVKEEKRAVAPVTADVAMRLREAFREAASDAIRRAHDAGIPVSVLGDDGKIAWLHPDGIVRPGPDKVRVDSQA
jgi:hypothetical protein